MFSKFKSFGLIAIKFLLIFSVLVLITVFLMPFFPSIQDGWNDAAPYVLCIKYLLICLCFLYWNQFCVFFVINESAREHYINLRSTFLILVVFIELVTWLGRGGI